MFFLEEHRFCVQGRGTRKRLESRFHLCGRISKFGYSTRSTAGPPVGDRGLCFEHIPGIFLELSVFLLAVSVSPSVALWEPMRPSK
jgi:hypothetical protein